MKGLLRSLQSLAMTDEDWSLAMTGNRSQCTLKYPYEGSKNPRKDTFNLKKIRS